MAFVNFLQFIDCCDLICFQDEIQQFKDKYIYKHIIDTDVREGVYPLQNIAHDV